jgi:predicted ester cyclase
MSDPTPMSRSESEPQEANRQRAIRFFEEVWNDRRDATVEETLHERIIGHMEGAEFVGRDPYKASRRAILSAFPDFHVTIEATAADGDVVVVRWSARGTHDGPGLGFEPTARHVQFRGMTWLRFDDGVVVEGWDSWNQGALLQSLQSK